MACRKAAYRAMTEMSEWMEKRQEEAAKKMAAVKEEQRKIWTPTEVFEVCCTPWLADGKEILGLQPGQASKGCNGGCGKGHPRITLDFQNGQTVANLSHALDPFLKHFDDLCSQGLARKLNTTNYELVGFIPTHHEKLNQSTTIGSHLVKISTQALASSKRAQERRLEHEELEQKAKKRKLQGAAVNNDLLDQILEICYNYNLFEHLDLVDIAWMRLSCKTMAKYAARMASSRLRDIRLSFSVLTGGEEFLVPASNQEQERIVSLSRAFNGAYGRHYLQVMVSHVPLSLADTEGRFVPENEVHLEWVCSLGERRRDHLIRVYLEGARTNAVIKKLPESNLLFSSPLEVARYEFDHRGLQKAVPASSTVAFNITSSQEDTPIVIVYTEFFSLQSVNFGFRDLLGVYARKKFRFEKQKMQEIKSKRPVTNAEKDFVRALAKEARAAPGNENDFEFMTGW